VGSYERDRSPYGVYDMAGNVMEWVADWYNANYYQTSPNRNPKGPETGSTRVVRGGSWFYANAGFFRCAYRFNSDPSSENNNGGFRCARTP
jgi:sulfatase modifying factor 1